MAHQEGHRGSGKQQEFTWRLPAVVLGHPGARWDLLLVRSTEAANTDSGTMLAICFRTILRARVCVEAGWKGARVDLDAMKLAAGVLITADVSNGYVR